MADFDDIDFDDAYDEIDTEDEEENMSDVESEDVENESNIDDESDDENISTLKKKSNEQEDIEEDDIFEEDLNKKSSLGNIDDEIKRINEYKRENIKCISKNGIIALLAQITTYLKSGHKCLNNFDHQYPNITHESAAIINTLCGTHPFIRMVNGKKIISKREDIIMALKLVLRPAESNTTIMFTPGFIESFPNFKKNLFVDKVLQEDIDEIDAYLNAHGLSPA